MRFFSVFRRRRCWALACTLVLAACGGGDADDPGASASPRNTARAHAAEDGVTWTRCAAENEICNFSGTHEVRYGLDGQYAYKTATDSIPCNNDEFGDPYVGADKICEVASSDTTQPGGGDGPYGQNAGDYELAFHDEFEGGELDRSVWNDAIWYESPNPTTNYAVEDGLLKIWPQRDANGNFFNRTLDTDGKYTQTYGYFEIEARLPVGKGTWPAFWLFNHIGDRRPEMDVMEAYAGGEAPWGFDVDGVPHPQAYAPTVWKGDHEGQLVGSRQFDTGTDLSAGFHKYGVKWEPGRQTYYFDGQEVMTVEVAMGDPMYLMLDLWFGSASGEPDDSTPTGKGNAFEVRYVRSWKFKGQGSTASRAVEYHGDSTIWGYRSGSGGQVDEPAPVAFASALAAAGRSVSVRNEGVSGSTACALLNGTDGRHARWSEHIAASAAQVVILNHAINDEWQYDVATYQSCLRQLAQLARAAGKQVIFETPNPTRDSGPGGLDVYVDAMKQVAAQEQVPVIDQYAYLTQYLAGRDVTTLCPDGLHPTQEVYTLKGRFAAQKFGDMLDGAQIAGTKAQPAARL